VTEPHATLRRSQTRFDSWQGRSWISHAPRECVGRTAVFEAARPGPIPGRGITAVLRPRSVTDWHTTLRRSGTRFNSWRGHVSFLSMTLEPDGQATGCNPVQVGSTPTGVFLEIIGSRRASDNPTAQGSQVKDEGPRRGAGAMLAGPRCPAGRGRSPAYTSPAPRRPVRPPRRPGRASSGRRAGPLGRICGRD
jgi:hypothetical protein